MYKKIISLAQEKQMKIISQTIEEQRVWEEAMSKLDMKIVKKFSSTLKKTMKHMISVKNAETEDFEIARQEIKKTAISLFKHLDDSGFTKLFCRVAPLLKDFSFEKGNYLLLDDIRLFKELKFPPRLWRAYCAYLDKHKDKFFLRIQKKGFKFMDLVPIVKKKMELRNDPIRKQSPFNWSCGIATGLGVIIVAANCTTAVPSAGLSVASVVAGGVGIGYSAGGGGNSSGGGSGGGSGGSGSGSGG